MIVVSSCFVLKGHLWSFLHRLCFKLWTGAIFSPPFVHTVYRVYMIVLTPWSLTCASLLVYIPLSDSLLWHFMSHCSNIYMHPYKIKSFHWQLGTILENVQFKKCHFKFKNGSVFIKAHCREQSYNSTFLFEIKPGVTVTQTEGKMQMVNCIQMLNFYMCIN